MIEVILAIIFWSLAGFALFAWVAWMYAEPYDTELRWKVVHIFPESGPRFWFWAAVMGPFVWGFIAGTLIVDGSKKLARRNRKG